MTIYQVGQEKDVPFLAMQLLEGESLEDLLKRGQPVPPAVMARIGQEAAEGLAAAHARGLIHRDIKPGNIWLEAAPSAPDKLGRVKVLDFGLARPTSGGAELTGSGVIVGTPAYMAPEQFRGEAEPRSDLFSLGCVLYRLLTGRLPFMGSDVLSFAASVSLDTPAPVRTLNPSVPPALADLVMQLLAKEPKDRPESAREVADRLLAIERDLGKTRSGQLGEATDTEVAAAAPVPVPAGSRHRPGRRWLTLAATLAAGLLLVAGVWVLIRDKQGRKVAEIEVPRDGSVEVKKDGNGEAKSSVRPLDPAWVKTVQSLPPVRQVREVFAELRRRNPAFDPAKEWTHHEVEGGVVHKLWFGTDNVADISPVRALPALKILICVGSGGQKGLLTDLSPLRGMKLTSLNCSSNQLSNLSPLKGMALTELYCSHSRVDDLSPLQGMPLTKLHCDFNVQIDDLSPLQGMKLSYFSCCTTRVSDLTPLKDMPLTFLSCGATGVTDLTPIKEMPLKEIWPPDWTSARAVEVLRSIKTLEKINGKPVAEVLGGTAKPFPLLDPAWVKKVQTLPAEEQVKEVAAELKRRNPGFDGRMSCGKSTGFPSPLIREGVVWGLCLNTGQITDLSPLRALRGLQTLHCAGGNFGLGRLTDLSFLKGMVLTSINFRCNQVEDLAPLRGLSLTRVSFDGNPVKDLGPLEGMPLQGIECCYTAVSDLTPLKDAPLRWVYLTGSPVQDLSPLKGKPVTHLYCKGTKVTDFSPLRGLPLESIELDFDPRRDAEVLRSIKTLKQINFKPAAELWKEVDARKPGKTP